MGSETMRAMQPQTPSYWSDALLTLRSVDPVMGELAEIAYPHCLQSRGDPFTTLVRSIVGQQISVKAADAIWARLLQAAGTNAQRPQVTPGGVLGAERALETVGLSGRKRAYLLQLAQWFANTPGLEHQFSLLDDEAVIRLLVGQPGIGRWTAEMFLIFTLMRPDIFPVDDLGILKAIDLHYPRSLSAYRRQHPGDSPAARRARAMRLAERWRPYRTVATWLLWRSLDPVPVAY
jgi:DNA-3-methyladenine glycosylase II